MAAGSIIVELLMKTGSFETDTQRASKALQKFQKDAQATASSMGKVFAAVTGIGSVAGFALLIKGAIDSADHLNDLSKQTGIAVGTLGGLGFAAQQSGGDLASIAAASGKLNRSLAEAAAGNKEAGATFDALNISIRDSTGNVKTADVALAELANKFAQYEDGPEKAALAIKIFGKAGAEIIPLLDEGGAKLLENIDYFKRYGGVTADTARAADEFNDTLAKLKLLNSAFSRELAAATLPVLQNLADLWVDNKEKGDQFRGLALDLVEVLKVLASGASYVAEAFTLVGKGIGAAFALAAAFKESGVTGLRNAASAIAADFKQSTAGFEKLRDAINAPRARTNDPNVGPQLPKGRAPIVADTRVGDDAAAALKKKLDAQIKLIEDFGKQQAQAYAFANDYISGAYQAGEISLADHFKEQERLRQLDLDNTIATQEKIIQKEQAFANTRGITAAQREEAVGKVALAQQSIAEAEQKFSQQSVKALQDQKAAVTQVASEYGNLRATLLSLQGNDLAAAQIKNAQQIVDAQKLVNQANGDPRIVTQLKIQLDLQAQSNQLEKDYGNLLSDISRKEEEINLDAALAGKGELETLAAIRDLRKQDIELLRQKAAIAAQIAADPNSTDAQKRQAADLAVALKKASSEIDPVAQRINQTLEDAFTTPFEDFINGTKSASDAFKDFAKNILLEVNKLVAKDIAKSIFGGNNGQSGAGGFISSLFGGGGGGGGGGGSNAGGGFGSLISSLFGGSKTAPSTGDFARLDRGQSAASSGGGLLDFFSSFGSLFGGFFADGGMPPMNKLSIVGEKGPELFQPSTAGNIIPLSKIPQGSGRTTVNNINVSPPPGMSRQTGQQLAAEVARQISRADRRNN